MLAELDLIYIRRNINLETRIVLLLLAIVWQKKRVDYVFKRS